RRVAEELDVALGERAHRQKPRALDPRTDDPDGDARDEANRHQAERGEKATEKTRAVERVIKDGEIDSGGLMERPEPLPQRMEVDHALRFPLGALAADRPRNAPNVGKAQYASLLRPTKHNQLVFALASSCIFLRNAEGGIFHFFSNSISLPVRCQSVTVFA